MTPRKIKPNQWYHVEIHHEDGQIVYEKVRKVRSDKGKKRNGKMCVEKVKK